MAHWTFNVQFNPVLRLAQSMGHFPIRRCSAAVDLPCRCQFILTLAVTLSLPFIDSQLCSSALLPSNPAAIRKGQCVGSLLLCCQCWCPLLRYLLALAFGWRPNEQPVRRRSSWRGLFNPTRDTIFMFSLFMRE